MRREKDVHRHNWSFLGDLIPDLRWLRGHPRRRWLVPYVQVVVAAAGYEETRAGVDSALAGTITDTAVAIVGPWDKLTDERRDSLDDPLLDLRLIHNLYRHEPRVTFVTAAPDSAAPAPFLLTLPVRLGAGRRHAVPARTAGGAGHAGTPLRRARRGRDRGRDRQAGAHRGLLPRGPVPRGDRRPGGRDVRVGLGERGRVRLRHARTRPSRWPETPPSGGRWPASGRNEVKELRAEIEPAVGRGGPALGRSRPRRRRHRTADLAHQAPAEHRMIRELLAEMPKARVFLAGVEHDIDRRGPGPGPAGAVGGHGTGAARCSCSPVPPPTCAGPPRCTSCCRRPGGWSWPCSTRPPPIRRPCPPRRPRTAGARSRICGSTSRRTGCGWWTRGSRRPRPPAVRWPRRLGRSPGTGWTSITAPAAAIAGVGAAAWRPGDPNATPAEVTGPVPERVGARAATSCSAHSTPPAQLDTAGTRSALGTRRSPQETAAVAEEGADDTAVAGWSGSETPIERPTARSASWERLGRPGGAGLSLADPDVLGEPSMIPPVDERLVNPQGFVTTPSRGLASLVERDGRWSVVLDGKVVTAFAESGGVTDADVGRLRQLRGVRIDWHHAHSGPARRRPRAHGPGRGRRAADRSTRCRAGRAPSATSSPGC